ncbi:EamA family transporter [Camelimonas abortus]|uniref:EamA family transporter n=1 Tax=Camelimonas abortus TaxID=1017184 RepID=A0ABV7LGI3_9HYPH
MAISTGIWIGATLAATVAQTARNAMQGALVGEIGAAGATQVRFIYGFPFACIFLAVICLAGGERPAAPTWAFALYALAGAVTQIFGTALMLWAISRRNFATGIAYTKTEPVLVALFSVAALGEHLGPAAWAGVITASAGVWLMSVTPGARPPQPAPGDAWRAPAAGIGSAALFALSSVCFRGAILALADGGFLVRASTALAASLAMQSVILGLWLALFDRPAFAGSLRLWRASFGAGFMGALASQLWFTGFSLTSAANVRTLALLEAPFAQVVSRRVFHETPAPREMLGAALVVAGVAALLASWG